MFVCRTKFVTFSMEKRNLRAMSTRVYLFTLLCCLSLGAATAIAETKPKKSPKPPPGYASRLAIMAAFGSGKLELIDQNAPLPDGVVLEKDIEINVCQVQRDKIEED